MGTRDSSGVFMGKLAALCVFRNKLDFKHQGPKKRLKFLRGLLLPEY